MFLPTGKLGSFAAVAALCVVQAAQSGTITVTTTLDVVAFDRECSLREAILNANGQDQSGSIHCAAGGVGGSTIVFDPSLAGATISLKGTQLPTVQRNLTIVGPVPGDATRLILDGDQSSRLLQIQGTGPGSITLLLRDVTLQRGRTNATSEPGGAIRAQNADVVLEGSVIRESSTAGNASRGGGIYGLLGTIELIDSLVEDNQTEGVGSSGGGVAVLGGTIRMERSQVLANRATGAGSHAGGILLDNFGAITSQGNIADSIVAQNYTQAGATFGGGLAAWNSPLQVSGSTFTGNTSVAAGGALYVKGSHLELINSTLSTNVAGTAGGGLHLIEGSAAMVHSTVAFNISSNGPVLSLFGTADNPATLDLVSSLVVQATPAQASCGGNGPLTITAEASFSTHESCTDVATELEAIRLAALADNGGATLTHALRTGSVAIDAAGDCEGDLANATDQRGKPRPGGSSVSCDAGAYEFQGVNEDFIFVDRFQQ